MKSEVVTLLKLQLIDVLKDPGASSLQLNVGEFIGVARYDSEVTHRGCETLIEIEDLGQLICDAHVKEDVSKKVVIVEGLGNPIEVK